MRGRVFTALAVVSSALGAGLVSCFDLFHSTADILTACEIDARAAGCPFDAGSEAGTASETDFCGWPSLLARQHAQHACAWLGACESPMGRNAFGPCMFQALLAYDCAANPNHRVKGKEHALWDCLDKADSCGAVDACIFPDGPEACAGTASYSACGAATNGAVSNGDVRVECAGDGGPPPRRAKGENCALWGQTCVLDGTRAVCAGAESASCQTPGTKGGCSPGRNDLQWCVDGGDIGIDCASNGAHGCNVFPAPDAVHAWVACMAESDAGPCSPDASATCENGVASSCPSGVVETIHCELLLSSPSACQAGLLVPPFDWTTPCTAPGPCTESCNDPDGMIGCARGASFAVSCAAEGLGGCRNIPTGARGEPHPACAPPP